MNSTKHVLVPRFADATNVNAQNLNAKSLVTRFRDPSLIWSMLYYDEPLPAIVRSANIKLTHLLPRHLWMSHLVGWYQAPADAIFYPGIQWPDECALRLRAMCGRKIPLISTLEALVGTPERERQLSAWAGHPVFCQRVEASVLRRLDYIYGVSDHIIAISPFLARLGQKLYGDKFSVHMLGVEEKVFSRTIPKSAGGKRVINVGTFQQRKRPEMFLTLAERFPDVEFVWFGEGERRAVLVAEARQRGFKNLTFPGTRAPAELAVELQNADIFAMPSNSEGVPKVTQEAAACGLPLVIYGYYESPTVIDGKNGFVVWNDEDFVERVGRLLSDSELAAEMGAHSLRLSTTWHWDGLAEHWEREILERIS